MKTIVSVLGLFLLAGAVALAQTSSTGSTSSKSATHDSSAKSNAQAGNSGFDSDSSSPSTQATSSGSMGSQSGSSGSTPSSSGQSSYGSSGQSAGADSIANGPVAETVTDSSALIGWATREAASGSAVKYGTSRANLVQSADATDGGDGKNHHAKLQGLSPNTRYYFQVAQNGQAVGGVGTFKTTASGEQPVQSKATIPQK